MYKKTAPKSSTRPSAAVLPQTKGKESKQPQGALAENQQQKEPEKVCVHLRITGISHLLRFSFLKIMKRFLYPRNKLHWSNFYLYLLPWLLKKRVTFFRLLRTISINKMSLDVMENVEVSERYLQPSLVYSEMKQKSCRCWSVMGNGFIFFTSDNKLMMILKVFPCNGVCHLIC